jgi:hypothetical protein
MAASLLAGCGLGNSSGFGSASSATAAPEVFEGPVARAACGPGSKPETSLQGQVPVADRTSGRAAEGYTCNLEMVGHVGGVNPSWQLAWYEDCAYFAQDFPAGGVLPPNPVGRIESTAANPGVVVVDAKDPAKPVITQRLVTPAMLDPHESLTVHQQRALLAGVAGWDPLGNGPAFFDIYDVGDDCAQPRPLASLPVNAIGHEGDFAPDGNTYYGTYPRTSFTAIDVSDAALPRTLMSRPVTINHGLSVRDDGNRLYLSQIATGSIGNGVLILDVSQVQARAPVPQISVVSELTWTDGATAQHTIPVTIGGKPHLIAVDEAGLGMARIIDITDETKPFIVSKLKNEIDMPDAEEARVADGGNSGFTYQGHYCGVDRRVEPTVAGCSYFWQGIRIFDIRDPYRPKEIAYFNPWGADGSYASARVSFIPERAEVWATDQANGFYILRFTNGVWPFKD